MRRLAVVCGVLLLGACAARLDPSGRPPNGTAETTSPAARSSGRTDAGARFDQARSASRQAMAAGDFEIAEAHAFAAVSAAATLGEDDPRFALAHSELAALYVMAGRYDEAEGPARHAAERYEAILGPGHDDTLLAFENYAAVLRALGREAEADEVYERARAVRDLR